MTYSKILVIGATGYIGKDIARASASLHHPTFVLVRPETLSSKADLITSFKSAGITVLEGSIYDHDSLLAAIKQVDVVISTVGAPQVADQTKIIAAIKEAGTIKRFFPSEFGNDFDKGQWVEPVKTLFNEKVLLRRAVEESQIPYTYVVSYCFAGTFLSNLVQPGLTLPPRDKALIYGSGDVNAIYALEKDVGTYTVKAVDDPRTLNKRLHIRPPRNFLTQNEVVALWEKKIGKTLEKESVSEEELLKKIQDTPFPGNIFTALLHGLYIKGECNFDLGPGDVESSTLYPEVKYTTIDEYLDRFV